uniref:Homeobox domain-containing protein n=1 Tax=Kalanchoe fedtschenkoi TaxID=63787 RepID=A0A7N0SZV9_KALFE
MEWEKKQTQLAEQNNQAGGGDMYMKVMTDEQMELLRHQISAYTAISQRLVDMHKTISAQQDLAGIRLGSLYCDPLMTSAGHKITARQRWTPTPQQLQRLEQLFDQGNGTPSKQKIKEITDELTKHGQISETNVYNWFQNRRARSKRKQSVSATHNGDSEVETEVESPRDKKTKPENIQSFETSSARLANIYFQNSDVGHDMFHSENGLRSSNDLDHFAVYDNELTNPRFDQFISKIEVPGNFSHFGHDGDYDMIH